MTIIIITTTIIRSAAQGTSAAIHMTKEAFKGMGMGLVAAFVYKAVYADSYKKQIDSFYATYVPPKEKVTFDLE